LQPWRVLVLNKCRRFAPADKHTPETKFLWLKQNGD